MNLNNMSYDELAELKKVVEEKMKRQSRLEQMHSICPEQVACALGEKFGRSKLITCIKVLRMVFPELGLREAKNGIEKYCGNIKIGKARNLGFENLPPDTWVEYTLKDGKPKYITVCKIYQGAISQHGKFGTHVCGFKTYLPFREFENGSVVSFVLDPSTQEAHVL